MANDKLKAIENLIEQNNTSISKNENIAQETKPNVEFLEDYFKQRQNHRNKLFWFAVIISAASLLSLIIIIAVQILMRIFSGDHNFRVFDGNEFEIFVISVFGQTIGVLLIITKAIWDGSEGKK